MVKYSLVLSLVTMSLVSCDDDNIHRKVDSFEDWARRFKQIETDTYESPLVATEDREAIIEDFVEMLNTQYMKAVHQGTVPDEDDEKRVPRMVYRKNGNLHVLNLCSLQRCDPEEFIDKWRRGISRVQNKNTEGMADKGLFTFMILYFDKMIIHTIDFDSLGQVNDKEKTVLKCIFADERDKVIN